MCIVSSVFSLHKACFMATLDFLLTLSVYTTMYQLTSDEVSKKKSISNMLFNHMHDASVWSNSIWLRSAVHTF